jgi:hypothetical protein
VRYVFDGQDCFALLSRDVKPIMACKIPCGRSSVFTVCTEKGRAGGEGDAADRLFSTLVCLIVFFYGALESLGSKPIHVLGNPERNTCISIGGWGEFPEKGWWSSVRTLTSLSSKHEWSVNVFFSCL